MHSKEPQTATYRIKISGHLKTEWKDWFNGMVADIQSPPGEQAHTTLTVCVPDQAALRGLLNKIWDLNLTVISVMIHKENNQRCLP